MLTSLTIQNLRGIRNLTIPDLGRVNLIIGPNEAGKTTAMAAAAVVQDFRMAGFVVPLLYSAHIEGHDLDRYWIPLFYGGDPSSPIQLSATRDSASPLSLQISLTPAGKRHRLPILFRTASSSAEATIDEEGDLSFSPEPDGGGWWGPASPERDEDIADNLLDIYQEGDLPSLVPHLQHLNPDIEALELAGELPYVRLRGHKRPLPLGTLGDGARRVLEFAIGIRSDSPFACFDEVENGLHVHSLPAVLRMFQQAPATLQIFATTHRDELVRVACETFLAANDPGLRVIRIDRRDGAHFAEVYRAEEALAAMESGLEIRG